MRYLYIFLFLLTSFSSQSQCPAGPGGGCNGSGTSLDLYWVGTNGIGSGDWNTPCSWRVDSTTGVEPCQAPRSIDNVFFNAAGFSGAGSPVITIITQARCNDFLVDPSINGLGNTPEFSLNNPGFLEVFGDFTLQTNLTWTVVGGNNTGPEVLFKATTVGHNITTAGHTMGAVQFDGIGGEWALQDVYNGGSLSLIFGYLNTSDGTNDHDMNLLTFDSDVDAGGTNANRRMDLNSSTITMMGSTSDDRYPYNTTNAPKTVWEGKGTTPANFNFNAGTSTILFTPSYVFCRLGGMAYNVIRHTGTGRFYDHFGPTPCNIDTLETDGHLYFHHEHVFNVLKINTTSETHEFFQHQTINTDLIVSGNPCDPTIFKSEYNRLLTMPAVVSADPMTGFNIINLRCNDGTAGHSVVGNTSGITTGWTITPAVARDLYWVGGTNNNWNEPTNWATAPAGVPLLLVSDCPPLQTDNVFFIPALANGATVTLDQESYCNNQTWTITAPATFNGGNVMNIYGNLQLDTDINFAVTSPFYFYGSSGNTIFSAGKVLKGTSRIEQFADYSLLDDLNFTDLYLFRQAGFNTAGFDMTGRALHFRVGTQDFSGSTITLTSSVPWQIRGGQGNTTYDASSHVIFTNTSAFTRISIWGGHISLPNFTLQSASTALIFQDHYNNKNVTFAGDVILNGSARFRADFGATVAKGPLSTVTISGDLTLNAGELYEFNVNNNVTIGGDLNASGDCIGQISIQGVGGSTFDIDVAGSTTLDYCNISDMNSVGAITATNSSDGGNNTNVTFPIVATTTYYWRALNGSCTPICNYNGDWDSPAGYWTTNPADTEGVPGCIPSAADNVVFDNMSYFGATKIVTINGTVSCHDLTSIGTNVNIIGTGNLKISGSVFLDGTLSTTGFAGVLDFISNDVGGDTIDMGGTSLGCDVNFSNVAGDWTLLNNNFDVLKKLSLVSGTLNTSGITVNAKNFNSNNASVRELNLGNSTFNITGSGNFINLNNPGNVYTWNTLNTTNLTFNSDTSTINFTHTTEPTILSSALDFHKVNFLSTSSASSISPVLIVDGWNTQYMKFDCSGRIYGDNFYDTLEFTEKNVYRLEGNSVQTLNAPDGILISTGSAGKEIAIKSLNTGTPATFHKLNTGGSMSSFCFDYISVEDNFASSDDPAFAFFTGINSNDISATGIWDFNRPLFIAPTLDSEADQYMCPGSSATVTWNLSNSGPYTITYTTNGMSPTTVTLPHGTASYSITVNPSVDTEYKTSTYTGDNCGVNTTGTIVDTTQTVFVPAAAAIAIDEDTSICTLNNEGSFAHFHESEDMTDRPIMSILDKVAGAGIGNITTTVEIDATVQTLAGVPYLQRRFGATPTTNESALVRLYFTQTELDALSTAWGSVLTPADLIVTKFDNNTMAFTPPLAIFAPTASGTIPAGITTTPNVLFLEIDIPSFSHFVIHPINTTLPINLLSFNAKVEDDDKVKVTWKTTSEEKSDHYIVEKSKNRLDWEYVSKVEAKESSALENNYSILDLKPFQGLSHYRLKQIDIDGKKTTYKSVIVEFLSPFSMSIYPNPTSSTSTLIINSEKDNQVLELSIVNAIGQTITNDILTINKGSNTFVLKTNNLPTGMYYVRVVNEDNRNLVEHIKLVIHNKE